MSELNFAQSSGRFDRWMDISTLRSLTIRNCHNLPSLFQDLTEAMLSISHSSLRTLVIAQRIDSGLEEKVDEFLDAIGSLECLYISVLTAERLDLARLEKHQSLLCLVVDSLNTWQKDLHLGLRGAHLYKARDLSVLAKLCPNLKELAITLPMIDFRNWEYQQPFRWSPAGSRSLTQADLVRVLEAIALFPKLNVLRLTHPPIVLVEEEDAGFISDGLIREYQWRHRQLAEQILLFLTDRGSPIQLLAFSPTVTESLELRDDNGHEWPHYYYLRGASTVTLPGGHKTNEVVAEPVNKHDISKYLDSRAILDYCG
ncbi:hypothetical protein FB567DRAFT_492092 [Paraphoma chrysanthemicola]|uniref:Uncharacterized protein n=1 Tax=Paraphoma chrysanthemicola TaxID=798071 RepID=A0A8K0W022_9PLEO|nr:hypothetical protein FB567DRAFT_492092 [Paraphoma chrysanthemicola]